jgi:hypothetical protein
MTEREPFLTRWARRKRAVSEGAPSATSLPAGERRADDNQAPQQHAVPADVAPPLPSLDSITAASDIRAFLASGVPADLTREALRRAWAADPAIRDFVGLAEYAWDYHATGMTAGFGPIEVTDELRQQVLRMLGPEPAPANDDTSRREVVTPAEAPVQVANIKPEPREQLSSSAVQQAHVGVPTQADPIDASQSKPAEPPAGARRPHGSALPK